jgi:hypothetical protein
MAQFVVRHLEEVVKVRLSGAPCVTAVAWKKKFGTSCATR